MAALSPATASAQTAYTWGYNGSGQLGNGTWADSNVPVAVKTNNGLAGQTVIAVAAGGSHSLIVTNFGFLTWAWGSNEFGQLSTSTYSTWDRNVPDDISTGGVPVTAIAGGWYHNLALANGKVYSWGHNVSGQLGDGTTTDSSLPVAVSTAGALNGLTVTAIAAGGYHSLAVANGRAYAFGNNFFGTLGDGTTTDSRLPVAVSTAGALNGLTVTAIAAGGYHSLAVANGRVYAWGLNGDGQLGNNSMTQSDVPVAVSSTVLNGLTVTKVAAGQSTSYALTDTGRLFAWGSNGEGELGLGSATLQFLTPQEITAPSGFYWSNIDADASGYHVVAIATPVPEPGSPLLVLGVAGGVWRLRRGAAARSSAPRG